MSPHLWRGRRVFLTGHTGFKGGWLALWLHSLGAKVHGYALDPPTQPSFFAAARIATRIEDLRGDIRDLPALTAALQNFQPELVFHLAAQPLVLASYADPLATFATNALGTANLLEAVRHAPSVRAVLCVTSDKCYDNRGDPHAFRESDSLGGQDPYSASKACAELIAAAYRRSCFQDSQHPVALATARAGNVIGGGDWAPHRLLPDLIRAFTARRPALIRNFRASRPWQHVLDPLYGYLLLAQRLLAPGAERFARPFNFGPAPDDQHTVAWIAGRASQLWQGDAQWQPAEARAYPEAARLSLDSTLARDELGWTPRLATDEALAWTIRWHRAFDSSADMTAFSLDQIADYENLPL